MFLSQERKYLRRILMPGPGVRGVSFFFFPRNWVNCIFFLNDFVNFQDSWYIFVSLPNLLSLHLKSSLISSISASSYYWFSFLFLKTLFIYSWERHPERQRHRQSDRQAPCRESDLGLDPRSPGSGPGLKGGTKPLSHRAAATLDF